MRYNSLMTYENTIEIGSVVKSLDFPHSADCYKVGIVMDINETDCTFRAKTIKSVWEGKTDKKHVSDYFIAPLPGHHFFDDEWIASRIQVVA